MPTDTSNCPTSKHFWLQALSSLALPCVPTLEQPPGVLCSRRSLYRPCCLRGLPLSSSWSKGHTEFVTGL